MSACWPRASTRLLPSIPTLAWGPSPAARAASASLNRLRGANVGVSASSVDSHLPSIPTLCVGPLAACSRPLALFESTRRGQCPRGGLRRPPPFPRDPHPCGGPPPGRSPPPPPRG